MLTKATIKIVQALVYLSHNLLFLIPFKFNSKFVYIHNRCGSFKAFNKYIWPLILLISLSITIFEFAYFCLVDSEKNLVIILYHGALLIVKSGISIAYVLFNIKGLAFCQLFNVIFCNSIQRKTNALDNRSTNTRSQDDVIFTLLLAICAVFLLGAYFVGVPTISYLIPCLHKTPLTTWLIGDCKGMQFRVLICMIQFTFLLPIGPIGALWTTSTFASIKYINKMMANLE